MTAHTAIAALTAVCLLAADAAAQPPDVSVSAEQTRAWAAEAARLALAEAAAYEIHLGDPEGPRAELVEQPALKWSNIYEATVFGSIYVWTRGGRPEAIISSYKFFTSKDEFSAELHSLAEAPLTAVKHGHIVWRPQAAGIEFKPIADAAAPAKTNSARLSQMRQIARDFAGELTTVSKTKHNLRLLSQPLLRYQGDESNNVIDGALFAFARATDPDVILVVEARGDGDVSRWEYALARMNVGALRVSYRDRDVWSVEELSHPYARPQGPYTLFQNLPTP
jgi:hypothetical protein